jgi:nitrate reductase gamma subunit
MNSNMLLFFVFPYITIILFIVATIYRMVYQPFSVSSLSTQLLERKKLFWGSIPFHYGILLVLGGHLLALLFPQSILLWNSVPLRLYLLELTGLMLGIWALIGLVVLVWRRISEARIRAVSTGMDFVVLLLLLVSVVTGVLTATMYRFGSNWFTGIFAPYLVSIFTLQPQAEMLAPLPWVIKLHVLNFFVLLAIFPFSRLIHIITWPLGYLVRPWLIVIWERRKEKLSEESI